MSWACRWASNIPCCSDPQSLIHLSRGLRWEYCILSVYGVALHVHAAISRPHSCISRDAGKLAGNAC